jgi:hypothetical protein
LSAGAASTGIAIMTLDSGTIIPDGNMYTVHE